MIQLGKKQTLKIVEEAPMGLFLNTEIDGKCSDVLLPQNQVPEGYKIGDKIQVYIYRDSEDRLIATCKTPLISLGGLAVLKVIEVTNIGAFLGWGLEKDLFLPFNEQVVPVEKGKSYLFSLYIDKTDRLCATMYVEDFLNTNSPYKKDDWVEGTICSIKKGFGAIVAVDNKYHGLIHYSDLYGKFKVGDNIRARVVKAREDGKLDLNPREKAPIQMSVDANLIYNKLDENGGFLPYNDYSGPEEINKEFSMSKGAFKRAIGNLYKDRLIKITDNGIEKVVAKE